MIKALVYKEFGSADLLEWVDDWPYPVALKIVTAPVNWHRRLFWGHKQCTPKTAGNNQIASEKDYPIDFSHFNINSHVFGAKGANETWDEATIFNVHLERTYGFIHPVRMAMPVILPALIKLNWQDYFSGAAMAGVTCVIGEHARNNDPNLKIDNGKITDFPLLRKVLDCFLRYDRGYGQIVLQCNVDDDRMGVPKIALEKYGASAIEIKFGQAAKGTQPAIRVNAGNVPERFKLGTPVYYNSVSAQMKLMIDRSYCLAKAESIGPGKRNYITTVQRQNIGELNA